MQGRADVSHRFIRAHQGCLSAGATRSPSHCRLEFQPSAYLTSGVSLFSHEPAVCVWKRRGRERKENGKSGVLTC